jgi:hypothetical protein
MLRNSFRVSGQMRVLNGFVQKFDGNIISPRSHQMEGMEGPNNDTTGANGLGNEGNKVADASVRPPGATGLNDKVQTFYMALRASDKLHDLINALNDIEDHEPILELGESPELLREFVTDCQKKSAQVLRAPYAESVRNNISGFRKRLASKVAKDVESSQQHSQRHLNTIIELLGSWSNIMAELESFQLSPQMILLICAPIHSRVIDMAHECFNKFQEDKNLDSWQTKVLASIVGSTATSVASGPNINLTTLDFLLSQMAAMRDIVNQYYKFISLKLGRGM